MVLDYECCCLTPPNQSTKQSHTPTPRNIVKETMACEGTRKPDHGHLGKWAAQGVLLLNNVLTVEAAKADSHKGKVIHLSMPSFQGVGR